MRGKKAKAIRAAVLRLFELNQAKFPIGYLSRGGAIYNVRRIMYKRLKKLATVEKFTMANVGGMFV